VVLTPLVILLLMGKAQVMFPSSDTPSPSVVVHVVPNVSRSDQGWLQARGIQVTGPVCVRWDQWQRVMVPLIASIRETDGVWGSLDIRSPLNQTQLCHVGRARRLVADLGKVIQSAFGAAGYG
jgi:hypothetical protein